MSNTGDMHWIQWKRTTQPFISHLCLDSCSPPFSDSTQEEHLHLGFGPRQVHPTTPPALPWASFGHRHNWWRATHKLPHCRIVEKLFSASSKCGGVGL